MIPSLSRTREYQGTRSLPPTYRSSTNTRTWYGDGHDYHHGGKHHHHGHYRRSGFYLGVYYPYHYRVRVCYPYVGYFHYYDYPYLASYGCGFYSGFYVRFGPTRLSYYAACPGFGIHAHPAHHCHVYSCTVHGVHHYHVRDCTQCYPTGATTSVESYVDEAELPPRVEDTVEEVQQFESGPTPAENDAPPVSADDEVVPLFRNLDEQKLDSGATPTAAERSDAYFAALTPAKLNFVLGFLAFEQGDYEEASEYYYNASLEDADSVVPKLFLSMSLVSIAEYDYAASYLRMALDDSPELLGRPFNLGELYGLGQEGDFEAHATRLGERADALTADADTQLLTAFVGLNTGDFERAATSAMALRDAADNPADRELGEELLREVASRQSSPATAEDDDPAADPVAAFLASPGLDGVKDLPIE